MQSLSIPIQENCLLRLLNGSFHAIEYFKEQYNFYVTSFFGSKSSIVLSDSRDQNQRELPNGADPRGAVFNSLDAMLKGNLDRLKTMREGFAGELIHCDDTTAKNYSTDIILIRSLCLEGKLGSSLDLWRTMVQERRIPDIITHNYLINAFCKRVDLAKAEWLVKEMMCHGPSPTCATFNTLMTGYCHAHEVDEAMNIFSNMAKHGVLPNRVSCNILVHALCQRGMLEDASKFLDDILSEVNVRRTCDVVTSTIFMDGYFKTGKVVEALSHWKDVIHHGIEDTFSYNVIIHGHFLSGDINGAYKSLAEMFKIGYLPDTCTYNTFIGHLCKSGKIEEACHVFSIMQRMDVLPDHITFKMLVQGLCKYRNAFRAHHYLCLMLKSSFTPRPIIWNAIIDAYGKSGDLSTAFSVKDQMFEFDDLLPNVYTYNVLIQSKLQFGNIDEALYLKEEMRLRGISPDVVTYNLLIGAACSVEDIRSAFHLYVEMQRRDYHPDLITYTQLLRCCCMRSEMRKAECVFFELQISGLPVDHVPFLILMKKYFKMGELDKVYGLYLKWLKRAI